MWKFHYRDLRIGDKLTLGFSALLFLTILIGLSGFWSTRSIQLKLKDVLNNRLIAMDYLIEADRDLQQLLVAERSMIFADVKSEIFSKLLSDYNENKKQSKERWEKYKTLKPFPEEEALFSEYEKARIEWEEVSDRIVKARMEDTRWGRRLAIDLSLKEGNEKFEKMRDYLNRLEEINLDIAARIEKSARSHYKRVVVTSISFILGVVVIGLFLMFTVNTSITRPVKNVVDMIRNIAEGEGDLTGKIEVKSKDEMGELARWFNTFVGKLHDIVSLVKRNSEEVAVATNEISSTSVQLATGAEEQMNQAAEVAATVQEMTSSIVKNSQIAVKTAEIADTASKKVQKGKTEMGEARKGMEEIVDSANRIGIIVERLNGHTNQIEDIIWSITDLATQTNVLALNASIEAANAGEMGAGFGIVALEVRRLVKKTKEYAQMIEDTISSVQSEIQNAASFMKEVNRVVNNGQEAIEKTEKTLNEIVASVSQTQEMVRQIAKVSEEQSIGAEDISNAVTSISSITKQSANGSEQLTKAATRLNEKTNELKELVEQFKLRS